MTGSVAQVLSATSVEVYFDGVAFGHEMSLDEIAPLKACFDRRLDESPDLSPAGGVMNIEAIMGTHAS